MKVLLTIVLVMTMVISCVACTQSPATQTSTEATAVAQEATTEPPVEEKAKPKTYKVGLAMAGMDVPFSAALVAGAQEAAAKLGIEIEAQDGRWDPNTQIGVIQNFITSGKDAIIIMEQTSGTLGAVCLESNQSEIPIVGVNRLIEYDGVDVVSNVLCDNTELGYNMAQACSQMLGGDDKEGKIGVIAGPLEVQIVKERINGIKKYMDEKKVAWEIIDTQDGNFQKEEAIKIADTWMTRFTKGEIDGAIVMDPYGAIGWSEVAKANDRDELIGKVVCNDAPKEIYEAIKGDQVYAAVRQDPKEQGYIAAEAAVKVLNGETVEKWVKTPLPIVTKDNLDEYPPTW